MFILILLLFIIVIILLFTAFSEPLCFLLSLKHVWFSLIDNMTNIKQAMLLEILLGHLNIPLICVCLFVHVWVVSSKAFPEFFFQGISLHDHKCAINPQDYRRSCHVRTRWPPHGHSWAKQKKSRVQRRRGWRRQLENRERTQIRWVLSSGLICLLRFSCILCLGSMWNPKSPILIHIVAILFELSFCYLSPQKF